MASRSARIGRRHLSTRCSPALEATGRTARSALEARTLHRSKVAPPQRDDTWVKLRDRVSISRGSTRHEPSDSRLVRGGHGRVRSADRVAIAPVTSKSPSRQLRKTGSRQLIREIERVVGARWSKCVAVESSAGLCEPPAARNHGGSLRPTSDTSRTSRLCYAPRNGRVASCCSLAERRPRARRRRDAATDPAKSAVAVAL